MRPISTTAIAALLLAAACTPKAEAPAVAAVDTAAARAGTDSLRQHYIMAQMAGDAAGIAGLYTEDATLDIYGIPRQHGRANIQTALAANYAARKYTLTQITPGSFTARTNTDASELGTYHDMHDAMGKKDHEWGRYLVGLAKGTDGMWRLTYVMAFPDSIKPAK